MNVREGLAKSSHAFQEVVWPEIQEYLGGGTLIPVEVSTRDEIAKTQDIFAGIDAWQVCHKDNTMRGLASRIQWVGEKGPWNSFTIRYALSSGNETEYSKRLKAIQSEGSGGLYPGWTIQAYLSKGNELLSVGCIKTTDLFRYTENEIRYGVEGRGYHIKINPEDGNEFICIFWNDLEARGYGIFIKKSYARERDLQKTETILPKKVAQPQFAQKTLF